MYDIVTKEKFVELRSQGNSFASIADSLDVSKATLINWSKESREDIGNFRQIHLEAMREKYRIGTEHRMEVYAKQLKAVEDELAKRDFANVPTERLFDLQVKLGRELHILDVPLNFQQRTDGFSLEQDNFSIKKEWTA